MEMFINVLAVFQIVIAVNGVTVLSDEMASLRDIWEATSFQLARLQSNPHCVEQEERALKSRTSPQFQLSFSISEIMDKTYDGGRNLFFFFNQFCFKFKTLIENSRRDSRQNYRFSS
jgi:hypothetical protein